MTSEPPDPRVSRDEQERLIRERAYQLWQTDGSPEGGAQKYWHQARELIERETRSRDLQTEKVSARNEVKYLAPQRLGGTGAAMAALGPL